MATIIAKDEAKEKLEWFFDGYTPVPWLMGEDAEYANHSLQHNFGIENKDILAKIKEKLEQIDEITEKIEDGIEIDANELLLSEVIWPMVEKLILDNINTK